MLMWIYQVPMVVVVKMGSKLEGVEKLVNEKDKFHLRSLSHQTT
jgi:hypothetical protein